MEVLNTVTTGVQRQLLSLIIDKPTVLYEYDIKPQYFDEPVYRMIFEILLRMPEVNLAKLYTYEDDQLQAFLNTKENNWLETNFLKSKAVPKELINKLTDHYKFMQFRRETNQFSDKLNGMKTSSKKIVYEQLFSTYSDIYETDEENKLVVWNKIDFAKHIEEETRMLAALQLEPQFSFGSLDFDEQVKGFPKGRLAVVFAREKVGKSTILCNWAARVCAGGGYIQGGFIQFNKVTEPVLYIDTEMDPRMDAFPKILACVSGLDVDDIRNKTYLLNPEKRQRYADAWKLLSDNGYIYTKIKTSERHQIKPLVKKAQILYGVNRVFLDYIKRPSGNYQGKDHLETGDYVRYLSEDVCKDLNVSMISAVQENKSGEIGLSHDIPREADITLRLYKESSEIRKIKIDESRYGPTTPDSKSFEVYTHFHCSRMVVGELKES